MCVWGVQLVVWAQAVCCKSATTAKDDVGTGRRATSQLRRKRFTKVCVWRSLTYLIRLSPAISGIKHPKNHSSCQHDMGRREVAQSTTAPVVSVSCVKELSPQRMVFLPPLLCVVDQGFAPWAFGAVLPWLCPGSVLVNRVTGTACDLKLCSCTCHMV